MFMPRFITMSCCLIYCNGV
uniref:Uncharacterized protein n=1 Tax=Anguilla anguilla TaxID=7936 RepID=A0A0E9VPD2_ANGAN